MEPLTIPRVPGTSGPGVAVARGDASAEPGGAVAGTNPLADLRPVGAGAILDGAFALLRSRFGRIVGLAACLYVPIRVLDLVTTLSTSAALERYQIGPSLFLGGDTGWSWVVVGLQSIALSILGVCVGHLAAGMADGRDVGFRELTSVALRRSWVALLVIPLGLLVRAPLSCVPLGFLFADALVFMSSVVAGAERLGPWRAWLRGMRISRDGYGRMLAVVLGGLCISQILRISFYAGPLALTSTFSSEPGVLAAVAQAGSLVVLVAEPLTACIAARAYLDQRCRSEGLDLRRRMIERFA